MAFYNQTRDRTDFSISFTSSPKYDFAAFAKGYHSAANSVAEQLIEAGRFPDYEAYPVVFLYRHSFELYLKNIIYWTARFLVFKDMQDFEGKLHNTHNLLKLSTSVEGILTKAFPDDQELHEIIANIICTTKEFSCIDSDSYSYRYPINLEGSYSTQAKQTTNLLSIDTHMDNLLEELDTISFGLNAKSDVAQEIYEAYLDF